MTYDGVILDLDGTVYRGDSLLPGAGAAIDAIRQRNASLCFFSNNPLHDGAEYVERLQGLGIDARDGEACSSLAVTCSYLRDRHEDDRVFLVGSDELRAHVADTSVELVAEPHAADVLLASWTDAFHYDDMVASLRAIDDETVFLGTDPDRTFPDANGNVFPGSGAILHAIAGVVERDPDRVLGKPSSVAVDAALDRLGCAAADCLVVGDRLDTDIAMGAQAGMTTALVKTGVTDDARLAASDVSPDFVLDSLADIDQVFDAPLA